MVVISSSTLHFHKVCCDATSKYESSGSCLVVGCSSAENENNKTSTEKSDATEMQLYVETINVIGQLFNNFNCSMYRSRGK